MSETISSNVGPPPQCNPQSSPGGNPSCVALVRVGGNGSSGGAQELLIVRGSVVSGDRVTWDGNLSDGLDSGWVGVRLTVESGNVSWETDNGGAAGDSGLTFQYIQKVQIRSAATGGDKRFGWRSVAVEYHRENDDVDPVVLPDECHPAADTTGGPGDAEQIEEMGATTSDAVKIVLTAEVRLESSAATLPGADSVLGEVHVFTS